MAITFEAIPILETVSHVDVEQLGNQNLYAVISGCTVTESASDMVVTVAAGVALVNGVVTTVAGNTITLVADATNKRWSYATINSSGTAVLVSGTPAASAAVAPTKPDPAGKTILKMYLVEAAQTIADNVAVAPDKRIITSPPTALEAAEQQFIETGTYKGFATLGAPTGSASYSNSLVVGLGFSIVADATTATVTVSTGDGANKIGMWKFSTGATTNEDVGVIGPRTRFDADWTLVWRGEIPSSASQTVIIGAKVTDNVFADENNIIAFRVSGTGNIVGVCDASGTESTRDSGATGAAECTLRIEVRSNGSIVRFYKDDVQIGTDVTTNIATNSMYVACGIVTATTADKILYTSELAYWREV